MTQIFDSLDELQCWVFERLLGEGRHVSPRGLPTLEISPVQLSLANPRRRLLTSGARKWNLPLAVGEFCWHVSASNKLSFIRYYSSRWGDFADDEQTIRGSCYGYRLFHPQGSAPSQWKVAQTLLSRDPLSRRAVLLMAQPLCVDDMNARDVACSSSLQFLVRNGRLDALLNMRSNDAYWGLPYDVFFFTMLQELLATELGLELGVYHHSVGSLHLYSRHVEHARKVLRDTKWLDLEMPKMSDVDELGQFLAAERAIRVGGSDAQSHVRTLPAYWRSLAQVLAHFASIRDVANASSIGDFPSESVYKEFFNNRVDTEVLTCK
jgi:thymidylate synthase